MLRGIAGLDRKRLQAIFLPWSFLQAGGNQAVVSSGKGEMCADCSPAAVPCAGHAGIAGTILPLLTAYLLVSEWGGGGRLLSPKRV